MAHDDDGAIKTPATYADVLAAPEHLVAELIAGTLYTHARPQLRHASVTSGLMHVVHELADGFGSIGGWRFAFEPELHLGDDVLVPDLAGWRVARFPAEQRHQVAVTVAPDWICEVLSPSTARMDRTLELPRYAAAGVDWVWLVDPAVKTIEVLARDGQQWVLDGTYGHEGRARLAPFEAIELPVARLFEV